MAFLFPLLFLSFPLLAFPLPFDPTRVTQLSWQPRAFLYKNFLSEYECDHLISLAIDKLEKSMVTNDKGETMNSTSRTSSGMFIRESQDEIVSRIEQRLAAWTFLPIENGEGIQVLQYQLGQKYAPHVDYFSDGNTKMRGSQRVATVLMYLSNVKKGGETVFPNAEGSRTQQKNESWSECAKEGFAVKPEKGDALLFFSLRVDSSTDRRSMHESCPVVEGEKWSATKWIHVGPFEASRTRVSAGECSDDDLHCPQWAAAGECQKNRVYMVGSNYSPGFCRKSCKAKLAVDDYQDYLQHPDSHPCSGEGLVLRTRGACSIIHKVTI